MKETSVLTNVTTLDSSGSKVNHLLNITIFLRSVIYILGVIGNGLVVYVTGFKMKKTVNTVWFLNLALADILFILFLIFDIVNISRNFEWPFGDFMCKFYSLVSVLNMFASIFLLTAISLDRCLSTWLVVWVQNKRTPVKAKISCFFIWLASICCSLPYCIYRKVEFIERRQASYCIQDIDLAAYKRRVIFRFVVGFLIPLLIITGSYMAIGVRVRRLRQRTPKSFRTIIAVILAFFFCWLPFHIYFFIELWARETVLRNEEVNIEDFKRVLDTVGPFIASLAFFNSCLNPILYVFMCEEFKAKLRQSLVAVFESAFAEEHLALLVSQYSISRRKSCPHSSPRSEDTQLST
ncbi:hypothetical protein MHYP_G00201710 [Metynnis hypsauchen]